MPKPKPHRRNVTRKKREEEDTSRNLTLAVASLKKDRLWDAVRDGLEHLTQDVMPQYQETHSAEDLYWALMRQVELVRVLWILECPEVAARPPT